MGCRPTAVIIAAIAAIVTATPRELNGLSALDSALLYVPSVAERAWFNGTPVDGRICSTAQSAAQLASQHEALDLAARWRRGEPIIDAHPAAGAQLAPMHVSQLVRCRSNAHDASPPDPGGTAACSAEPIEPLSAIARHPLADVGCPAHATRWRKPPAHNKSRMFDIRHIILHSQCPKTQASSRRAGRNLFFDVGCTVWDQSAMRGRRKHVPTRKDTGFAVGPSLPLFRELYAEQCVHFDHMWGWEAQPYPPEAWWRSVPAEVRPHLTFVNKPVRTGGSDEVDPLLTLARVAREEDFVAFKLDIDMFAVEHEIIHEIATNARGTNASRLIDELFFEYHFIVREKSRFGYKRKLMFFWGGKLAVRLRQRGGSVEDALRLMRRFREMGIRSHFWI